MISNWPSNTFGRKLVTEQPNGRKMVMIKIRNFVKWAKASKDKSTERHYFDKAIALMRRHNIRAQEVIWEMDKRGEL